MSVTWISLFGTSLELGVLVRSQLAGGMPGPFEHRLREVTDVDRDAAGQRDAAQRQRSG